MQSLGTSLGGSGDQFGETAVVPRGPILYSARRNIRAAGCSKTIAIRLADDASACDGASRVLNRQYGARGYGTAHQLFANANTVVFTASTGSHVFGTITLSTDSEAGLASDKTFPEEMAELRSKPGRVLCELTKFAFDPSPDSRPFLASLFHIVYIYGVERFAGTDLVIEVNPRHVRFYEMMLGFKKVGKMRDNASVGAPSQLMHVEVAHIGAQILTHAGQQDSPSRSLYPYFFTDKEEMGLRNRIRRFARTVPAAQTTETTERVREAA